MFAPLATRRLVVATLTLTLAACGRPAAEDPATQASTLTVLAPQTLVVDDAVIGQFEQASGIAVSFRNIGPPTGMVERILTGEDVPQTWDLVYGIDNLQLESALAAGLFQPYASPALAEVPDALELDPEARLLPVSHNYVMLNADRAWFGNREMALPASLDDLRQPEYAGLLTLPSPIEDQAGRGFLAATAQHYGEDGFTDFWQDLAEGGARVTADWTESYLSAYTVGSNGEGDRPLIVAYASAPAADIVFSPLAAGTPPSQVVDLPGAGFHQVDLVGIATDTPRVEAARALVDFLLGPEFQASVAERMFAFPARQGAPVSESFREHALPPAAPVEVDPGILGGRMPSWLASWQGVMARED